MAAVLVAEARWRALQVISDETNVHYSCPRQAARALRGILSARSRRRLRALDAAFAVTRHITTRSVTEFERDLRAETNAAGFKRRGSGSMAMQCRIFGLEGDAMQDLQWRGGGARRQLRCKVLCSGEGGSATPPGVAPTAVGGSKTASGDVGVFSCPFLHATARRPRRRYGSRDVIF